MRRRKDNEGEEECVRCVCVCVCVHFVTLTCKAFLKIAKLVEKKID